VINIFVIRSLSLPQKADISDTMACMVLMYQNNFAVRSIRKNRHGVSLSLWSWWLHKYLATERFVQETRQVLSEGYRRTVANVIPNKIVMAPTRRVVVQLGRAPSDDLLPV
jgi:hypothetical protein